MPSWMALGFQDSMSPSMVELSYLHDHVMASMVMIMVLITYIMVYMIVSNKSYKFLSEGTFVETVWSVVPAAILIILVVPSMKVLYCMEESLAPSMTVKILGHQWYWSYQAPLLNSMGYCYNNVKKWWWSFDSVFDPMSVLSPRLLHSSASLILPMMVTVRLLISSVDVIHSFAVPGLGLKVDAMPGRVNQLSLTSLDQGVFYGQCSEICGSNHSFMPISVSMLDLTDYLSVNKVLLAEWVYSLKG